MKRILVFLFAPIMSYGAVFDLDKRNVATYIRGSLGNSYLQQSAYRGVFPSTVALVNDTGGPKLNYSGEAGLTFRLMDSLNLRIGVEALLPAQVRDVTGTDAAAVELFSMTSEIFGFMPVVNLEAYMGKWKNARWYLGGGAGYAMTTVKNTVKVNDNGLVALGVPSFIEEASGTSVMIQGFVGFEFALFENVSTVFEAGYRNLLVNNYTHIRDANLPVGSVKSGAPVKNFDQTNRSTNFSGPWGSLNLRIYF